MLHVASGDLWGGAEAQVAALCKALSGMPGLELKAVVLNAGELAERLAQAGVPTQVLPEQALSPLAILWRLVRLVRAWPADIVHTHRLKENILGSLAARLGHAHSVRTVHGAEEVAARAANYRARLARFADAVLARRVQERCVAVSEELRARLERVLPGAVLTVIENGLDAREVRERASIGQGLPVPPGKRALVFVGRLVRVKRVECILEALLELKKLRGPDFVCFIVGEGPLRTELETLTAKLGVTDVCRFLGFRADIERCIAGADALVLASEHEGLPMTVLEAAALGTPVVATRVGGLPALFEALGGGSLSAPTAAELACNLDRVLQENRPRGALTNLGVYDINTTAKRYARLYQELTFGT